MKLETGIHPGRWHAGAWLLLALLLALALALSHQATGGGAAWAADQAPEARPSQSNRGPVPRVLPGATGTGYVTEVVDSLFFVSPAGFLALDLPRDPAGSRAVHLTGSINVRGRNRDIIVRLFRSKEYDAWLHPAGTRHGTPLWASKRGSSHQLDLTLSEGGPFVLLLDNGYSIRTPKHVSCQIQIQYQRGGAGAVEISGRTAAGDTTAGRSTPHDESNPVTPRGNEDSEMPPPPPPPPAGY